MPTQRELHVYYYLNVHIVWQINKVITGVSYFTHRHTVTEEEEWLTAERMAVSIICCFHKGVFRYYQLCDQGRHVVCVLDSRL